MRDITADLDPPLGYPGGSCHLIDRAVSELGRNSEPFVKQVEEGEKFTRTMEQELYDDRLEGRVKGTGFRFLALTPHAQYRMDQRGINEQEVRAALRDYWKEYSKNPQRWQRDKEESRLIPWGYRGVRVVFAWVVMRRVVGAQIITVVEEGVPDPGPMMRDECKGWGGWSKVVPMPTPLERLKLAGMGDCYEANGKFFMDQGLFGDGSMRLVHGEVSGQGPLEGVNYGHAWVEDGNTVIDVSNGRNLRMPKALYYALGNIEQNDNLHKYTPSQFRRKVTQYEHWGPWDLKTSTGL